jgi:hypothetical protein
MIDISETLRFAHAKAASWDPASALQLASEIGSPHGGTVDWDGGAGESWARLIDDGRVVAYVSTVLPLVIVEESATSADANYGIASAIVVTTFEAPVLSAGQGVLGEVFGESDRLNLMDPSNFSADDLWYATV